MTNPKFTLRPYSIEDAPVIYRGKVYDAKLERIKYNKSHFHNATGLNPECQQLFIERTCKACEGSGTWTRTDGDGVVGSMPCKDCDNGSVYEIYRGHDCGLCKSDSGVQTCKDGKIDHTKEIVELLAVEKPKFMKEGETTTGITRDEQNRVRKWNQAQSRLTELEHEYAP